MHGRPHVTAQLAAYTRALRRAKLVVGDASVYRYGLMKLAEIPAAGALLLTDLPLPMYTAANGAADDSQRRRERAATVSER